MYSISLNDFRIFAENFKPMRTYFLWLSALFSILPVQAQNNEGALRREIEEIRVESFFFKQKITSSTSPVGVISDKNFGHMPLQGVADALKLEPAVAIKSDGVWPTAPAIRGLSGQRIIVAVDGNRMETATEINGGMSMINVNDIQRIEIIKSGASSMYGSGAIGGVVNFVTQPVVYSTQPTFNALFSSSYQSVNHLFDEYLRFAASKENFFFSLSGSYRLAQNTQTPMGELLNSQFEDYALNAKLGCRINERHELRLQHQNFQAREVGVPGSTAFKDTFTVTFPEHRRIMTDVQYRFSAITEHFRLLKIKAYQQGIFRDVLVETANKPYTSAPLFITPTGEHRLWGGLLQTDFEFDKQKITMGLDLWQRNLETHREKFIILPDSSEMVRGELPLPKAKYLSSGIFAGTERRFFNDRLNTTAALRYDYITVRNDEVYNPDYLKKNGVEINIPKRHLTIEKNTRRMRSWSANLGANYQLFEGVNVALSGGHSFRAPNVEELHKYITLSPTSVRVGNADLTPERSYFADLGIHYNKKGFSLTINGFVNKINAMIAEEKGTVSYDNYDAKGEVVGTDTLEAYVLNNIEEALLYGFDATVNYEPVHSFLLTANWAYTIGKNLKADAYLPQIAPMSGRLGAAYKGFKPFRAELNYEWAAGQNNIASGEAATKGYGVFNINLSSHTFSLGVINLQAFGGVKNLLNTAYTNHLSTNRGSVTVEPGRNFYLKVRVGF